MIRRDQFLDKLNDNNSSEANLKNLQELEKFVDEQLISVSNINKFVNSISATTSGLSIDGFEIVDLIKTTTSIHRDLTVDSNDKITIKNENNDVVTYSIWSDTLKFSNGQPASNFPQNDKVIAETFNITLKYDGKLRIKLPDGTNKFVAKTLANKYSSIGKIDENKVLSGYFSQVNYPNTKNNLKNLANTQKNDAVKVLYDKINNITYLEFSLF